MVQVLIGVFFVGLGVVSIWKRTPIARVNRDLLRAAWGRFGEPSARGSTPGMIAFVGFGSLVIGSVIAANGLIRLFY